MESDTRPIGRVVKPYGVAGQVVIRLERRFGELTEAPEWVFLRLEGGLVPFRVADDSVFQKDPDHIVIGLQQLAGPEEAAALAGSVCNLPGEPEVWFGQPEQETSDFSGYSCFDPATGKAGTVTGLNEIPGNPLLEIVIDGQEAYLPFQPEFIRSVDHRKRQVIVSIPEGLLSL